MPHIMKIKISLDFLMTIFMILAMAYNVTGVLVHEIIGVLLFLMFVLHNYLNRRWYSSIIKKNKSIQQIISKAINFSLCLVMIVLFASGVIISQHVFTFLALEGSMFARQIHVQTAYLGYILISLHLGLHWMMIVSMLQKIAIVNNRPVFDFFLFYLMPTAIFVYGIKASFDLQLWTKIIQPSPFSMFLQDEPFMVLINFIAIMGMYIFIVHNILKVKAKLKTNLVKEDCL